MAPPDSVTWVRIISWHIVAAPALGLFKTLCGRYAEGPVVGDYLSGKSCERCAQILIGKRRL